MINYTISIQDCYLKVLDTTNNKFQDLKLSNIRIEYDSSTFLAADGSKEFKIAVANLSRVNSGAFATFTDLWSFINTGRSACLESNNNLNGDITGTFAENIISKIRGKAMPDGAPGDKNILMFDAVTDSYIYKDIYKDFPNIIFASATDGVSITGVTTEQISNTMEVDADIVSNGDILRLFDLFKYTNTNGTKTSRLWINTANNLSGAILLATSAVGATTKRSDGFDRILAVKAGFTEVITSNLSFSSSSNIGTSTLSTLNIDWSVKQYIHETIQLSNGSDVGVASFRFLEKISN